MIDLAFNPNLLTQPQPQKQKPTEKRKEDELFLSQFGLTLDDVQLEEYDASQHINQQKLEELRNTLSDEVAIKYKDIENISMKNNLEQFSKLTKEIIEDGDYREYNRDLEKIRLFPKDFLANRGIFLSISKQDLIETYDYLYNSSLYQTNTDEAYTNRYMLPIRLPNGDTLTHTGYRPKVFGIPGPKYETAFYDWMSQGSILGNMESLMLYPDVKIVYVVEGMMDAYRINQVLKSPSVALLGSILSKEKKVLITLLKQQGYTLIYVPDQDASGLTHNLLNNDLFDNIMMYGDKEKDKDFDAFCGQRFVEYINEKYADNEYMRKTATLFDLSNEEIFNIEEQIKKSLYYKKPLNIIIPKVLDIRAFL